MLCVYSPQVSKDSEAARVCQLPNSDGGGDVDGYNNGDILLCSEACFSAGDLSCKCGGQFNAYLCEDSLVHPEVLLPFLVIPSAQDDASSGWCSCCTLPWNTDIWSVPCTLVLSFVWLNILSCVLFHDWKILFEPLSFSDLHWVHVVLYEVFSLAIYASEHVV